jgi:pyruvate dehydrogenase E2 component (dihydrolipoamide acetyltransferase)
MPYEFKLPDIGEGVAEGEIIKWMVREGDKIGEDQPLVEVMTDKVNVQIPSPKSGSITKLLVKEGEVAKVGQPIVIISEEGESERVLESAHETKREADLKPEAPAQTFTTVSSVDRVLATPAVRRLARESNVDLTLIKGTGPHGRIIEEDVRAAVSKSTTRSVHVGTGKEEIVPMKGIRKIVAEKMSRSSSIAAHVTHVDEVDMTELVLLKEAFKGSAEKRGVRLTFLPFIIKAMVPALKEFPYSNATLDDKSGNIILKKYYNIGIATDTDQGLIVPVIKDADRKNIFELAGELEKLIEKARANQLGLDEVHGSTFTITNLGAIGGLFATPIINHPEVAILGVHKIMKRPVIRDGKVEVREMMYLSLSFDHRVIDGAYAARFMNSIIEIVQDPKKLLSEIL